MAISRRKMIGMIGGGAILAAGGGAGWFVSTRTPHKALEPWARAGSYQEARKHAISYAILAPNPHNLQPWRVDLREPEVVTVYRDPNTALPHTDPFDRQITIGFGCFLELLKIAAAETGHDLEIVLFPDGEGAEKQVARITFKKDPAVRPDPLFSHVLDRRSCKEPFDDRKPDDAALLSISDLAEVISEKEKVSALRELTWKAWMTEAQTPRTHRESIELMRMGKDEINANPDGIDMGGPFLEALMLVGALSREQQLDPSSQAYAQGVAIYREMLAATPAYVLQKTDANTRRDQILSGRRWLRLNLTTTSIGLSLHPVSQILQEYDEMSELRSQIHERFATGAETIQMLGRLGYGPKTPQTPRWPLEERIKKA